MNGLKDYNYKGKIRLFWIVFFLGIFSIQSQIITGSREITYDRLNEFAKLYSYSISQDSVMVQYEKELTLKDSILTLKDKRLYEYKNQIIPAYKKIQANDLQTIKAQEQIIGYKDAQIGIFQKKKWTWAIIALSIGAVIGLIL